MIYQYVMRDSNRFWFILLCISFLLSSKSPSEGVLFEKNFEVFLRDVGHELLNCLGDDESRVMPIEKNQEQYVVSFESDFSVDPDDIVLSVDRAMKRAKLSNPLIVEMEQCDTKDGVHIFMIGGAVNLNEIACAGRVLPTDCYRLLVTVVQKKNPEASTSLISSKLKNSGPRLYFYIVFLLLIFMAGLLLLIKKKPNSKRAVIDIKKETATILLGRTTFDDQKMQLTFKNSVTQLSNKEAKLLDVLQHDLNQTVSKEEILQKVWSNDGDYVGRTLDVFISKLRKKFEADSQVKIVNVRGVGYRLVIEE